MSIGITKIEGNRKNRWQFLVMSLPLLLFAILSSRGCYQQNFCYENSMGAKVQSRYKKYFYLSNKIGVEFLTKDYKDVKIGDSIFKEKNTWKFNLYRQDSFKNYHYIKNCTVR
jgi:hypothetical protein